MTALLRLLNALVRRFDAPVEQHPVPHPGCVACVSYARGYLRGVTDAMAYERQDTELRRVMRLWEMPVPAGYPEAEG